jgi:hypothetical protein
MKKARGNPKTNAIGAGVTEGDVLTAIKKSGYPLQTITANRLQETFHVQEEWSYIDRDSGELRTIDILAQRSLFEFRGGQQPRVRPQLTLLLECKQCQLPYVFFLSRSQPWLPQFPILAGLATDKVTVSTDDDRSTWTFSVLHGLGLDHDKFHKEAFYSTTLSKCVRKGADLELSGSESYNSLVLPLIKAMQHFKTAEKPVKTAYYFDAYLTLGIGVLDAPMIGVTVEETRTELRAIPWVRVLRHESLDADHPFERSRLYVIDVIHADYVTTYLTDHLIPFAEVFAARAIKHQEVIATGSGFISGMGRDSCGRIEERLRYKSVAGRIARRLTAKKKSNTDEQPISGASR